MRRVAVGRFGLVETALGFGLVVMALGTMTTVEVSRRKEAAALSDVTA